MKPTHAGKGKNYAASSSRSRRRSSATVANRAPVQRTPARCLQADRPDVRDLDGNPVGRGKRGRVLDLAKGGGRTVRPYSSARLGGFVSGRRNMFVPDVPGVDPAGRSVHAIYHSH